MSYGWVVRGGWGVEDEDAVWWVKGRAWRSREGVGDAEEEEEKGVEKRL